MAVHVAEVGNARIDNASTADALKLKANFFIARLQWFYF
jgi:hypothetical protein